ncbi:hypothetical protein [Snodgrassella alvi]|nr:hypothetical protein [Snodgrassella alvi]UOO98063.1 hypothetical protein LVJ87_08375 [Snodgrassella alvi wkB2]
MDESCVFNRPSITTICFLWINNRASSYQLQAKKHATSRKKRELRA